MFLFFGWRICNLFGGSINRSSNTTSHKTRISRADHWIDWWSCVFVHASYPPSNIGVWWGPYIFCTIIGLGWLKRQGESICSSLTMYGVDGGWHVSFLFVFANHTQYPHTFSFQYISHFEPPSPPSNNNNYNNTYIGARTKSNSRTRCRRRRRTWRSRVIQHFTILYRR